MSASDLIGSRISHYQLLDILGQGGMGVVYRALDTRLERTVALKVIHPEQTAIPGNRRRFQQEGRAASAITHPNVAHVYEIGEADGLRFIAMEYVEGEPLSVKLAGGPLEEPEILEIGTQIAEGLAAAHAKGIVHRDIKPSNIVITPDRYVKILDFGLAKTIGPGREGENLAATVTRPGLIVGTVHYMSPEQALGHAVDTRSDLFSTGVLLYQMATGAFPFEGATSTEILSRILQSQPSGIARYNYTVSAELERIIRKCLEKDPACRYQMAGELVVDLRNLKRDHNTGQLAAIQRRSGKSRRWWIALAGGGVLAAATGYLLRDWLYGRTVAVAVLPLLNLTNDPDLEYLSEGIADNVVNSLSHLSSITVRPRASVYRIKERYQKGQMDAQAVGRELKVNALVTGRLFLQNASLVMSAELIDIDKDSQIWGDRYTQPMSSIFLAQEELAREIANGLRVHLTAADRAVLNKRPTLNSDANHLYLKGRYFLNRRTVDNMYKGAEYFQAAIDKDPKFSLAYAGMADCYMFLGNVVHPREMMPRAKAAAHKAIELDPLAGEPHATLGYIGLHYDWNWAETEASFKRALRLSPQYPTAHSMYARYLSAMGRTKEALSEMKKAQDLDPLSPGIGTGIALCYYLDRQNDRALEALRQTMEIDPRFHLGLFNLGRVYTQKGMYNEAIASYKKGLGDTPSDAGAIAELGYVYGRANRREEALECIRQVKLFRTKRYVQPSELAMIHAALGERDAAFALLEEAWNDRSSLMAFLKVEPRWDIIRSDKRFQDLLRRMALS